MPTVDVVQNDRSWRIGQLGIAGVEGNSLVGAAVTEVVPIDRGPGIGGAAVPARVG